MRQSSKLGKDTNKSKVRESLNSKQKEFWEFSLLFGTDPFVFMFSA